ncbi:MAG: AAA family ATPase [Lachnospiraceae bacterium]|nr:AAA family ATPase [Lachnospiraceae bacterium]
MAVHIAVGDESFDEIRKTGLYYVDKSDLLYDLVGQTNNKVTLFTRPRRFGKTLNLSMMESFFDINRDSRAVFDGLNISKHRDFCSKWMNQYPVLFISFKDVDGLDFESAYKMLAGTIAKLCIKFPNLEKDTSVSYADVEVFHRLLFKEADQEEIKNSLQTIMRMMHAVYGKPVILLIDEYDVPLAKASEKNTAQNRFYEQMLDVIKGMLSIALKTNEYLKFAVGTGCLRIAKESIFTGTNNFASYSVLDEDFSEYFGFTQEEVDELLSSADRGEKAAVFKEWYDGYIFGNTSVYCPWDVASYAAALLKRRNAKPKNYWRNTSGNGIIRDFVGRDDLDVSDKFETLLSGGSITEKISDELTYDTLHETEQNLWSVLLMTGYLTKADPDADEEDVPLKIPNAEISRIFEDTVVKLFTDTLDTGRQRELMSALWSEDTVTASRHLNDFLWDTISFMDYHEDYYHAFLVGLFVGLGYAVDSNKESGLGRFDVLVKDRRNRRVLLIEAKKSATQEGMGADCDDALRQIEEKGYVRRLEPGYEKAVCYGIAFFRKFAMIKKPDTSRQQ